MPAAPTQSQVKSWQKILLALAIGTAGGWLANSLQIPLAWMIGAMLATTVAAMAGLPIALPMVYRTAMVAVLGVMLGSGFAPEILDRVGDWGLSLLGLIAYTIVSAAVVTVFLRKVAGYDPVTAYFSASPGGLSEMVIIGTAKGGDERIISLTHTSRILLVVLALPFVMQWVFGFSPGPRPAGGIPLAQALPFDMAVLTLCGLVGFFAAKLARLPAAAILGPMVASAAVHLAGWSDAKPPTELVAAAQVVVGTAIGCRFAGVGLRFVGRTLLASLGSTIILVAGCLLFALMLHPLTGLPTIALFLAYAPGGVAEMSLIALALSVDAALVASHHIVRIFFIVVCTPMLFQFLPAAVVGRKPAAARKPPDKD
ncbi:AbrB family transcriptional regulator [Pelagibius litoralis]|uniref:AbrB family transcriptional regulator n=1 Tax=Pelagibius litoralis TaxID=374515 RepID=A0A967EY65_9PROT|nr:AbrB family transcriptional regulator [Pelagibius litoralis]NIA69580.1 AbrB family transcriptional regulator [Pelagibius litoralis]